MTVKIFIVVDCSASATIVFDGYLDKFSVCFINDRNRADIFFEWESKLQLLIVHDITIGDDRLVLFFHTSIGLL